MVKDCIIYCRVSTESQAKGHGLQRQLETCQKHAGQNDYRVGAVFSEIGSGADSLPVRAMAERVAKLRNCDIICENYDRWSRQGASDAPPINVVVASESARECDAEIRKILFRGVAGA